MAFSGVISGSLPVAATTIFSVNLEDDFGLSNLSPLPYEVAAAADAAPAVRLERPGDVVVMDNLSSHKRARTRELIESVGAELEYLPPYSPDLNPIEKMWSKIKALLRRDKARDQEALLRAIGGAFACVSDSDISNWFASFGYSFI